MTTPPLPTYECLRVAPDMIRIDGRPDEPPWRAAPVMALGLYDGTGIPRQPTRVRMLWDEEQLYLAYWVADRVVRCTMTDRDDRLFEEEVVEFFTDAGTDLDHYYEWNWNALGACFDALVLNREGKVQPFFGWDSKGLEWAVSRGSVIIDGAHHEGWSCEIAIPWHSLDDNGGQPPRPGDQWRMNHFRIERAEDEEYCAWSPVPGDPPTFHRPNLFGVLVFSDKCV